MSDEEFLDNDPTEPIEPVAKAARIAALSDALQACLAEADRLGLNMVGAHISMALNLLETGG